METYIALLSYCVKRWKKYRHCSFGCEFHFSVHVSYYYRWYIFIAHDKIIHI